MMTFLRRMEEKKAIHHEDGGRAKLYYLRGRVGKSAKVKEKL